MWESDADLRRDLDEMVALGVEWVRLDLGWASMEPTKGTFNWSNTDRVVDAVVARGLKVVAILHETPKWARAAGTDSVFYPPTDPADFADFAGRAVSRYSNRVKVWEVLNEPNISRFWMPQPDPGAYTTLLKLAYSAIKKANASATVLSAGLSPAVDAETGSQVAPATFLRKIYENGGKGSFDAVGIHPYSYPARPIDPTTEQWNTFQRLPVFYDVMVRNGDGDKKLWVTEFGAPTGTGTEAVSEAEQAANITDAFRAMAQLRFVGGPLFAYALRDAGTDPLEREDNFGVLRRDFSAKPSRAAFEQGAAACMRTQPATVSISDVSLTEGDAATTPATFTVTRSGDSTGKTSVQYATANESAIAGTDFVGIDPTTLSFAAGETTKTVTVAVNGDTVAEGDETFAVRLSSASGATISDDSGLATVFDDDTPPGLAVNDVTAVEGSSGTPAATFTITRAGNVGATSSVRYATVAGTASATSDFAPVSATMDFAAGERTKAVTVNLNGDTRAEPDETFSLRLSSPISATIADDTGVGTILNDDNPPSLSVNDVSVTEGTLVGGTATFTITRSGDATGSSSVQYATAEGTATAGTDFTSVLPAVASFAAGETAKTVTVAIVGDLANEPNETVLLNLSSPNGATIADAQGVATIVDDDLLLGLLETPGPATFIAVTDATVVEGNSGTANASFTVVRTGLLTGTSSVQYATAEGTGTAGSDFVGVAATAVSFAAGEAAKTVTVAVAGDTIVEPSETFLVKLSSPVGAVVADDTGVGTIFDDDVVPTVAVNDASVTEGSSGTTTAVFTITRYGITAGVASVQYATADGTATAGSDFVGLAPTTVQFASGETTKTVTVTVNGGTGPEDDETFSVRLSSPVGATIADGAGVGTIFNDDAHPTVRVSDVVSPGGDTDAWAIFEVTRSGATTRTSSVRYATAAGTAAEGTDFVGIAPTTLTFAPQELVKIVAVKVKAGVEADETFSLRLSEPTDASVGDAQGGAAVVRSPAPAAAPVPAPTTRYQSLAPSRILDTRRGLGAPQAPLGAGQSFDVPVTGQGGVPASGVSAVVLNVTVTGASVTSSLTAWPTGETRPEAFNLNFRNGQTTANLVVVKIGAGGKVSVFNAAGNTEVIADVAGWFDDGTATTGARYQALTPSRILDTRSGNGAPAAKLGAGGSIDLQVTGRGGVPASGVSAVVLNVTVTEPTAYSYLTVWPSGQTRPPASNLNFATGETVPNLVVVKLGAGGKASLFNALGSAHVIADVAGWYDDDAAPSRTRYRPLSASRVLDTRNGNGAPAAKVGAGASIDLQVTGRGGVPTSGVSAVVMNVTVSEPTAYSYLTAWPTGEIRPTVSNLNFVTGRTRTNLVAVKVGSGGKVSLFNALGSTHVIAEVVGWYDLG